MRALNFNTQVPKVMRTLANLIVPIGMAAAIFGAATLSLTAGAQASPSASFSATPTSDGAYISGSVIGLKDTTGVIVDYGFSPVTLSNSQVAGFSDATDFSAVLSGLSGEVYYQIYDLTTKTALGPISTFFTASGTAAGYGTTTGLISGAGAPAGGTTGGVGPGAGTVTAGGGTDNTGPAVAQAYFTPAGDSAAVTVMVTGLYTDPSVTVKYGTSKTSLTGSAVATESAQKIPGVNGIPFSGVLYGLQPTTTYYYSVYASDGSTDITPTIDTDGKTKLPIPTFATIAGTSADTFSPGVVKSMTTSNITQTTATISGTTVSASSTFQIMVDTKGDGTYITPYTPTVSSDKTFTFNLTALEPAHVYGFVATKAGDPTVYLTYRQSFMTPPVSVSSYLSTISDTSVTIAAKFTDGTESPAVIYGTDSSHLANPVSMTVASDGSSTATISGLTANTAYEYEIVGTDSGTQVPYTNPISFLTAKTGTTTTTPPTVGKISDSGATVTPTSYSSGAIVQCIGGIIQASDTSAINATHIVGQQGCSFADFISLLTRVINFLLFLVAPIIATGIILYAGILILTSGGSAEKISQAKGMFFKAVIGLAIAMGAWIIVKFVLDTLGYDTTTFAHFY